MFPSAEPFLVPLQGFQKDREKPAEGTEELQCREEMLPTLPRAFLTPILSHSNAGAASSGLGPADGRCSVVLSTPAGLRQHAWEERAHFFQMAQLSE